MRIREIKYSGGVLYNKFMKKFVFFGSQVLLSLQYWSSTVVIISVWSFWIVIEYRLSDIEFTSNRLLTVENKPTLENILREKFIGCLD